MTTTAQVTFPSTDMAQFVADVAGTGATRDGSMLRLDTGALISLAAQPSDLDGHYDGSHIWVGGTEYEVARA